MKPSDVLHEVPVLVTRFSAWSHPQTAQLYEYAKQSCDRSLKEVAEKDIVSRNAEFAACGGLYVSWIYPAGDFERLKVAADFYSAWVFIDDLIDNSTDLSHIRGLLDDLRDRVAGSRQGNHGLDFMHRLFTNEGWDPEVLRLTKAEMSLWFDRTMSLRKIEAEKQIISVEEYLSYRQTNAAMGMMYLVMVFTMPSLASDLLQLNQSAPDTLRRIFSYCGRSIGVILDLYKLNANHAQMCEYSHIVKIIQHSSQPPLSLGQAMDRAVELFHEYEDKLVSELDEVAAFSPELAQSMEAVHAGSIMWLNVLRGSRYVK